MLSLLLFLLLSYRQICFYGSTQGLNLWFEVLIPTLLPFIIISNILLNVYYKDLKNPSIYMIFMGFCCGCPMAAICGADLYQKGVISKEKCESLIGICNCLSPAFLVSFCFMKVLGFSSIPLKFLIATYFPPVLMLLLQLCLQKEKLLFWKMP